MRAPKLCFVALLPPAAMGVLVGLLVLAPGLVAGLLIYNRSTSAVKEEIRGNLRRLAKAASSVVDPELHKTFTSRSQEGTPEYERAIEPLQRLVDSEPSIYYVYTSVLVDGKVQFVLDPTPAGDADGDGVDDKSHIGQVYPEASQQMIDAFEHKAATADAEPYEDSWGTFISGYAPILDKNGDMVGVIGVDLSSERYAARLEGVHDAGRLAFGLALLISVLVGLAASQFQRRRLQWAQDLEGATMRLQSLADSLDTANAQLRFASNRFEQLFNLLPMACFTFDKNGTIYEWNRECEELTGLDAYQVVQRTLFETVVEGESRGVFESIISNVYDGTPVLNEEWTAIGKGGEEFTVVVNAFPLVGRDGTVTGGIAACADITQRKKLLEQNQKQISEIKQAYRELDISKSALSNINQAMSETNKRLTQLATVDALTEVFNRRTVFEELEREMSSAVRNKRPLSVLMLDIDHFKALNDTHGHLMGDSVLKGVAKHFTAASRLEDIVGRYGGEEFLIILPSAPAEEAVRVAERIRKQIADADFEGVKVTISIGVNTLDDPDLTSEQFLDVADRALYEAKHRGRNRVVHGRELGEAA